MPFIAKEDFKTHLYTEIVTVITRGDDTIIEKGINAAMGEAKSYLSRFDLPKIFGTSSTEPEVDPEYLETAKDFIKQIACWKMIKLSNPSINLELFKTGYDEAIAWFTKIQKGGADPEGWPYKPDDTTTPGNENSGVQWSSNKKRSQHY